MYGLSPSLLSFWLNSVQNTLPDPMNLRRWGKQASASCSLCHWKNCSFQHIICSCKVALEQGRISFRHDSVLPCIVKWIKMSLIDNKKHVSQHGLDQSSEIVFVKQGQKVKKKRAKQRSFWNNYDDWKILVDTRQKQYQIPSSIASTSLRPDICVYSEKGKKVSFIELTSPAEENINIWKLKKRTKYLDLVEEAKANGFTACSRTIEVGARGFVSKSSLGIFYMFGYNRYKSDSIRRELSKIAIRCSHFIWINRENKLWSNPNRVC